MPPKPCALSNPVSNASAESPPGCLAIVLHTHLPFVRHPEHPRFLEEDWLFHAMTECYLPLLKRLYRLREEGVAFRLAISLTPPLASMLRDPLLQDRYLEYLVRSTALAGREIARTAGDPDVNALARFYHDRFIESRNLFLKKWNRDLVSAFGELQDSGHLEIIACAATHGLLPLLDENPACVRAQVLIGCDFYRQCFNRAPAGIWLPECAYSPALEPILQEADLRWFVIESHGLLQGNPPPTGGIFAPCYTPGGPAAFARDAESSRQVWSGESGYPGDPSYRDFYSDVGFDLSMDDLRDYLGPESDRRFTGIKYNRITGKSSAKETYRPGWAAGSVASHARDFVEQRLHRLRLAGDYFRRKEMPCPPVALCPFDTELFGHWWFEGVDFLERVIREVDGRGDDIRLVSPSDYLRGHPRQQIVQPSVSSWGEAGYFGVWADKSNAWVYPHLHEAGRQMAAAARRFSKRRPSGDKDRVLRQMARELLLAESSDWGFLMKTGTARRYSTKRTSDHILRFQTLARQLERRRPDTYFLDECEKRDNIFPNLDWRIYGPATK